MQSRRDQVQAHLFTMSRMSAGMMRADPDTPDAPTARNSRGIVGGAVVAGLLAIGVAVYGLIVPGGNTSWRTPGAFVMVKNSSARYLYVDGALHPVLNKASAKLVAGTQMSEVSVGAASLKGARHGAPFGIVGAPDSLPDPSSGGSFYQGAWWACGGSATDASGSSHSTLSVSVGAVGGARGLTADEATLVSGPTGGTQLLWDGRRFALDTAHGAASALSGSGAAVYTVDDAFLDMLTAGPDIGSPAVSGRGRSGPVLSGRATRYGQLFTGPGGQHYLLREDGLIPLTDLLYALVRSDPRTQSLAYAGGAVTAPVIGPQDLAAHQAPAATGAALAQGLPVTPPHLVTAGARQDVCTTVTPRSGGSPSVSVAMARADDVPSGAIDLQPGVRAGCLAADEVSVAAGKGALVKALSSSGTGTSEYLVTDSGVSYPLQAAALKPLGYDQLKPVSVPAAWLQLLPAGPALDPAALGSGSVVEAPSGTSGCSSAGPGA
jgi:type VII secretion protein EccB